MLRVLLLMEFQGHAYTVTANVLFMPADVRSLMELSAAHYDGVCKSASKVGGFLYGIHNAVCEFAGVGDIPIPRSLSWREVDTLCKILEQARTGDQADMYRAMRAILSGMSDAERAINGPPA